MVYRSSRRPPQDEDEAHELQSIDSDGSDSKESKSRNLWKIISIILILICVGLTAGIIKLVTEDQNPNGKTSSSSSDSSSSSSDSIPLCGTGSNAVEREIDLSEPEHPGPFHDLTKKEILSVLDFLEKDPSVNLVPIDKASPVDPVINTIDVLPAKKKDIEAFLSGKGPEPERRARAVVFRPDLKPPVVQELGCGPLPDVKSCKLIKSGNRRNPVEYLVRPVLHPVEMEAIFTVLFPKVDAQIGDILQESYGMTFTNCGRKECFKFYPAPMGSSVSGSTTAHRNIWIVAQYPHVEYYAEYVTDFGMLMNMDNSDPTKHYISKIWYSQQFFASVEEFIEKYKKNSIKKTRMQPPTVTPEESFSSLFQKGEPYPEKPQRPPTLIEPDGKRYSVKNREVEYLGWQFNFRISPMSGTQIHNIRFRGERIAYELSMNEISVLYSANNPMQRMTDYADSGAMLGLMSRTLVPGADCPHTATFIPQTFTSWFSKEPMVYKHGLCLFENNDGTPVRRHSSYSQYEGAFYGGMLDSALTLRTIFTVVNYDYVVDFIFHQTGAIQTRVMSTGYILPLFFNTNEKPYGFNTKENFLAPIHLHIFSFKADLDISGTSNRYETLDIKQDTVQLRYPKKHTYHQTKFERNLKKTEKEALFNFNFDKPKYHIVHNDAKKTKFGEPKSYRIHMEGMAKQLLRENENNEGTVSWGRHQLIVTKHKDEEYTSSSPYAMFDSLNPVVNFSKFYEDNENLVDEDLVFWITSGIHHIPHSEDLPITPTVGAHLNNFIIPFNYFPSCPSFNSRDSVLVRLKDMDNPDKGVNVHRHGYKDEQCKTRKYMDEFDALLKREPDIVVEA